ncbi:MAG: ribose-phosphate diphosphokinase [Holosporaceae bacterium]|jgi:ribose-phosphate pyrophosphokinase|nr:ribose-phosphate diphosphokinase [Holosporaceae bacterium]
MDIIHTRNSQELARGIAKELSIPSFTANVRCFGGGEICVSIPKHFRQAIVVAATISSEDWMELFLLLDALRDTEKLILCATYMGYSRQNIQNRNESFGAGLFPRLLERLGISRLLVLENHCEPFAQIPLTHISAEKIFIADIISKYDASKIVIVSPDIGGARRAMVIAKGAGCNFAICSKTRDVFNELKKIDVLGDVFGKVCILVDDIIDSGATMYHATNALLQAGGKCVVAYGVHGILSGRAVTRLIESDLITITLTDSIWHIDALPERFRKLSIASLMADTIRYIL